MQIKVGEIDIAACIQYKNVTQLLKDSPIFGSIRTAQIVQIPLQWKCLRKLKTLFVSRDSWEFLRTKSNAYGLYKNPVSYNSHCAHAWMILE